MGAHSAIKMNVLFLGLKVFNATGGIEQVNRNWLHALSTISKKHSYSFSAISMYDVSVNADYISPQKYNYCKGNRWIFGMKAIWSAVNANYVIISHLNLSLFVLIAKLVNPRLKIMVQLHGIEAWANLSGIQERLLYYADNILAVSEYTKKSIENRYPDLTQKITVVNNSLDPIKKYSVNENGREEFRTAHAISNQDKLLITVGRLSSEEAYKGYDKTIEAIAQLNNVNVKYHIIGKYDDKEKTRVETLIDKFNLSETVRLIGYVDEEQLENYYQAADLFVMPSKGEGFGLVFIDSMARGLRVIGGNADGSVDAISAFEESALINPDDVHELANTINELLDKEWNLENKKRLSEKCKALFSSAEFEKNIDKLIV